VNPHPDPLYLQEPWRQRKDEKAFSSFDRWRWQHKQECCPKLQPRSGRQKNNYFICCAQKNSFCHSCVPLINFWYKSTLAILGKVHLHY